MKTFHGNHLGDWKIAKMCSSKHYSRDSLWFIRMNTSVARTDKYTREGMQFVCACVFRVTIQNIMSLIRLMPWHFPCWDSWVRFTVHFCLYRCRSFSCWCSCYFAIACLLKFLFSIHVKFLCFVFYQWTKYFRVYLLVNRYTKIVRFENEATEWTNSRKNVKEKVKQQTNV